MSDRTATTFPKIGPGGPPWVDRTVTPSRNTTAVPRGSAKHGMVEPATAVHRATIQERLGAKGAPQAVLYRPNAAEAGLVQRNVHQVPSAIGNRDFYLRRQYGQGM